MKSFKRVLRHLSTTQSALRRDFGGDLDQKVQALITESERVHRGQLVVVLEANLDPSEIWAGKSARDRALELFSELRVWDTAENNGVLIYVLVADRDIEILADRGIAALVPNSEWERIAQGIEAAFREGSYFKGLAQGIEEVTACLTRHFPIRAGEERLEELPNKPVIL